jgi:serine/threonine protein kinase
VAGGQFADVSNVVAEVGSTASTYLVLAKLAVGGMAEIFLARGASAAGLQRYVVLKRILRERANDAELVAMFMDEARLAAQLQHPNVAQVYDIGKLGDSYFFTMEYVHGETVRGLLHEVTALRRRIPISAVLSVIAGAAAGLHHAHERRGVDGKPLGIVHRDVSPSNLMISYEGGVKVVDFGVAKAETRAIETRSGTVKGKIGYLSPEQCRGEPADRRSDLFSLGIVLWEMLVGERLYRRGSDFDTMSAIVTEAVTPPSRLRDDIPPELDALTLRLLAKRAADRPQTADDVVDVVEALASKLGLQLSPNALGRFLREVFGTRKEPWIELDVTDADGVTVIGEPVLAAPPPTLPTASSIDEQLDGLEDLSVHLPYSESSAPRRPTTPYRSPSGESAPVISAPVAPMAAPIARSGAPRRRAIAIGGGVLVLGIVVAVAATRGSPAPTVAQAAAIDAPAGPAMDAAPPDAAPDAPVLAPDAEPAETPAQRIERAFTASAFTDVIAACGDGVTPEVAAPCTIAACRTEDVRRAKTWLARVPAARRAEAIVACRAAGVELAPRPRPASRPKDKAKNAECLKDPMACQH